MGFTENVKPALPKQRKEFSSPTFGGHGCEEEFVSPGGEQELSLVLATLLF